MKPKHVCFASAAFLASALAWSAQADVGRKSAPTIPKRVYVVNTGAASLSLVDLATMKEVKRIKVGASPYGVAVGNDGRTVAVGIEGEGKIRFYDAPSFKIKGELDIGKMHHDHIVLTKDGKHILVANYYSDDVLAVDMATMKVVYRLKNLSAPHVVRYGPRDRYMYVTCKKISGVAVIDPVAQKVVNFQQLTINPRSLTFSPDESKVYFGAHWVNGFFEADMKKGKVTRLFELPPPADNAEPQEVTYHGVQAVYTDIVLAANEGRSYIDAVDVKTGKLLDRFSDVAKPCCIEPIPGYTNPVRMLVSNIGDGTVQVIEVARNGKMTSLGKARVGKAPKRVAYVPVALSR